jgi:putative ABC transport system substrate-binding protein
VAAVAMLLLALLGAADVAGQPTSKTWRIAFLGDGPRAERAQISIAPLREGLRDLGYVEGRNLDVGGLIAYAPSRPGLFRRAAVFVDRIARGGKPAEIPIEQPTAFQLRINLKTARTLGLTIPASVLARADEVLE